MAKPVPRVATALLLLLCIGASLGQIAIPRLGSRGEPPAGEEHLAALIQTFSEELRAAVRGAGLQVDPAQLITPGIAGSLDPEYARLIAEIEGVRYAVSGEVAVVADDRAQSPFVVNMIVVDREQDRVTDLISRPLGEREVKSVARDLARVIVAFTRQAMSLPSGDAGLFVSTQPGNAEVFLDGVRLGSTPALDVVMLAPGRYQLEVRKEGFLPEVRTVDLRSRATTFESIQLAAIAGGSIQVVSSPPAQVFLEGRPQGFTPLFISAPPGVQSIRLERDGFLPAVASIPVRNYRVSRVDLQLEPASQPLLFWDVQREYTVFIDGVIQPGASALNARPGLLEVEVRRGRERRSYRVVLPARGVFELDLATGEVNQLEL